MAVIIQGNAFVSTYGSISGGGGGGGSLAIENCKGHVHVFSDSGSGGGRTSGFYAIDPEIPDADGGKVLIMGVPLGFQEIVQPTVTLDDKRTLYIFGSAWSEMQVVGMLLLGEQSSRGAVLDSLLSWYESNRVSVLRKPVRVSLGTSGVNAYVVGLRLDQADPRVNTQMFSIQLLTPKVQK